MSDTDARCDHDFSPYDGTCIRCGMTANNALRQYSQRIRELEAEKGRLIVLLSQWLATYDDDYQPDGDLIDDTLDVVEALEGQKKGPEGP